MPTFDISRDAFDPRKHYSTVRMQQGKPLLDDDFNEAWRIENELSRRTQTAVIGGYGSPDDGFRIVNWNTAGTYIDFDISAGSVYLGGSRSEMERARNAANISVLETFRLQRDWLQKNDDDYTVPVQLPNGGPRYDLVYLEAWRQPVCAVEDSSLYEKALGSTDTSTRMRNMRRIHLFTDTGSPECAVSWKQLREQWKTDGLGTVNREYERIPNVKLSVSFTAGDPAEDLCTPSIAGGYLGAENQAIRVQLIDDGHLTWGFDNAAPLYRVTVGENGKEVTMITTPKDQYHWPQSGQVVEILPWSAVLPNGEKIAEQSGFLTLVDGSYSPDLQTFTMKDALPVPPAIPVPFGEGWKTKADMGELAESEDYFYMRIWNRGTDRSSPPDIPFTVGVPLKLGNTGLKVKIEPMDAALTVDLVPEDFWVIAARPETPEVLEPWELKDGLGVAPMGVRRFFAPLAVIEWSISVSGAIAGKIIHDCRRPFRPLTGQDCCCTFTVGDGLRTRGDFNSIQEAVDSLPADGGKICVLPGIHTANVSISGLKQIIISGCGDQTIVRPDDQQAETAIFHLEYSQRIRLENMTLVTIKGRAIEVIDPSDKGKPSEEITVKDNRILSLGSAVYVHLQDLAGDNNIKVQFNMIGMFNDAKGKPAIFTRADDVLIERNRIVVIPVPEDNPPDPGNPGNPPGGLNDPCLKLKELYAKDAWFKELVWAHLYYVSVYVAAVGQKEYETPGGIQIGCGSEKVWILENEIFGGSGYGILLGHREDPPPGEEVFVFTYPALSDLKIEGNRIQLMGTAGIGPLVTNDDKDVISEIVIRDIGIFDNRIMECALQVPSQGQQAAALAYGGIILSYCQGGNIEANRVERNGRSNLFPICGVFILFGEDLDISENQILENGPQGATPDSQALPGYRGGIVVRHAYKAPAGMTNLAGQDNFNGARLAEIQIIQMTRFSADPCIRIQGNIVIQPLGHALYLYALGPASVVGNQFTSLGVFEKDLSSLLAGAVFILDTGMSKDLLNILIAVNSKLAGLASLNDPSFLLALLPDSSTAMGKLLIRYQLWPGGKVMYSSNQTTLDLRSTDIDFVASGQLIASLDDINFSVNQSEVASLVARSGGNITGDIVLFNSLLIGATLRCSDSRFTDGFAFTTLSLFSFGCMNSTTDNQATHCMSIVGLKNFELKAHNLILLPAKCKSKAARVESVFSNK